MADIEAELVDESRGVSTTSDNNTVSQGTSVLAAEESGAADHPNRPWRCGGVAAESPGEKRLGMEDTGASYPSITDGVLGEPLGAGSNSSGAGFVAEFRRLTDRPFPPVSSTLPRHSSEAPPLEARRLPYAHPVVSEPAMTGPAQAALVAQPERTGALSLLFVDAGHHPPPSPPGKGEHTRAAPLRMSRLGDAQALSLAGDKDADLGGGFSPSSYPPTSPLLPPPQPGTHKYLPEGDEARAEDADAQGEVAYALDDSGVDWRRHTRVYGGGICLACAAAEGAGGFYGDHVRLEDRR